MTIYGDYQRHRARRIIAGVLALSLVTFIAACGGQSPSKTSSEGWSYTDGLGNKIVLDSPPKRVVASYDVAAGLADMGLADLVVGVFGENGLAGKAISKEQSDLQSPNLDLTKFENLSGTEFASIKTEKLLGLNPDLVIDTSWNPGDYWYINDKIVDQVRDVAPIIAIKVGREESLESILTESERLATALGAKEADINKGRTAFKEASDRLKETAQSLGDPRLLLASSSRETLWIWDPASIPEAAYMRDELGLNLIAPPKGSVDGGYTQSLSRESADEYSDMDVIVARTMIWDDPEDSFAQWAENNKLWTDIPAVKDGSFIRSQVYPTKSSLGYARGLESFSDQLSTVLQ